MKPIKSVFFIALSICSLQSFSQTDSEYAALNEFIPAELLNDLSENNEMRYKQMAVINKRGYHVSSAGDKDISLYPSTSEISKKYSSLPDFNASLAESGELNLLGYHFKLSRTDYTYYKIAETNRFLVIPPVNLTLQRANLETN